MCFYLPTRQRKRCARPCPWALRAACRPGQRAKKPRRRCDNTARRRGELGGGEQLGERRRHGRWQRQRQHRQLQQLQQRLRRDQSREHLQRRLQERAVSTAAEAAKSPIPECEKNRVRRGLGAHYVCGIEDTERRLRLRDSIRRDRKSFARVSTVCGLSVPMRCNYGTFLRVCDACRAL